jgi:hypothetical protein
MRTHREDCDMDGYCDCGVIELEVRESALVDAAREIVQSCATAARCECLTDLEKALEPYEGSR